MRGSKQVLQILLTFMAPDTFRWIIMNQSIIITHVTRKRAINNLRTIDNACERMIWTDELLLSLLRDAMILETAVKDSLGQACWPVGAPPFKPSSFDWPADVYSSANAPRLHLHPWPYSSVKGFYICNGWIWCMRWTRNFAIPIEIRLILQ